jgi:mono/diheme cytochrome c family protein
MNRTILLLAGFLFLPACEKPEMVPPSPEERVQEAEQAYDPALFDTIQWPTPEDRLIAGNEVYAVHCRSCHGPLGAGDTPYARERDLDVPSLVEPGWAYAGDVPAVRHRTFTGHPAGMPIWGIAGITPREIDAVAHYIVEQLRADVGGR